jgi:hypothetical protein
MPARYIPKEIHTANMPHSAPNFAARQEAPRPFITIAQQIGAEQPRLAAHLAEALTAHDPGHAWSQWDRELIEKVSQASRIPAGLIDSLETSGHSWLDDLLNGIAGRVDDVAIFHRVRDAIRDLAVGGHAILIGHGSTFITHDLPGGLHVRLIATMRLRISNLAAQLNVSAEEARRHIRRIERQRQNFFARFGLGQPLAPEMFSAVLNGASLDEPRLTRAILAMLPQPNGPGGR